MVYVFWCFSFRNVLFLAILELKGWKGDLQAGYKKVTACHHLEEVLLQIWSFHSKYGGSLGTVSLIVNPKKSLYSGDLLGIYVYVYIPLLKGSLARFFSWWPNKVCMTSGAGTYHWMAPEVSCPWPKRGVGWIAIDTWAMKKGPVVV